MPIVCPTITSSILGTNTLIDVLKLGSYQLKKISCPCQESNYYFSILRPTNLALHRLSYPKPFWWITRLAWGVVCPYSKVQCLFFSFTLLHMSPTKYWLHKLLIFRWIYCVHLYPSPPHRRVQLNKWVTELVNYWRKAVLLDWLRVAG